MMKKPYKSPSKYLTPVASDGGRPRLILNEEGKQMVEVLSGFFCTDEDMAAAMNTSVDVLTSKYNKETFSECKERGFGKGKVSLRRSQMKLAERSAAMAIWLGKQYLDQRDVQEVTISQNDDVRKEVEDLVTQYEKTAGDRLSDK